MGFFRSIITKKVVSTLNPKYARLYFSFLSTCVIIALCFHLTYVSGDPVVVNTE